MFRKMSGQGGPPSSIAEADFAIAIALYGCYDRFLKHGVDSFHNSLQKVDFFFFFFFFFLTFQIFIHLLSYLSLSKMEQVR